jgi:hypothetical protein
MSAWAKQPGNMLEKTTRPEVQHTRPRLLIGTAAFAVFWMAARARIQSITIDEADTYLSYVGTSGPSHWTPASNNHVLNSMLMRLSSSLFGVSNLSLRAPALLGAVLYVAAVYVLVRLMTRSVLLAWALFVCMVLNPMVMDYLVAARGYSLALAFLMSAIAVAARGQTSGSDPRNTCAVSSVLVALSFSANFSFALVDAVTLGGIAWWCSTGNRPARDYARIAAAAVLPGFLVALYLTGAVVLHWPGNELRWGATTFVWSMQSIGEQCFYKLSPHLVSQPLYDFLIRHRHLLLPLLGLACVWRLSLFVWEPKAAGDPGAKRLARLGLLTGGGALLTIALHGLLVWRLHMLWPRGRTGLYLPPLCILAAGAVAALPCASKMSANSQRAITALLAAMGCYFILCMRLTWFMEWYWNANSDRLYSVVAYYNRSYGVRSIGTNWRYVAVLNYYRTVSGHETLDPIALERPIPSDRQLYVLFPGDDKDFATRERLKVVYHDPISDAWVAIRPELETGHK